MEKNNIKKIEDIKKNKTKTQKKKKPSGKKKTAKSLFQGKYIFAGAVLLTVAVILLLGVFLNSDKVINEENISSENGEILSAVTADEMGFPVVFSNNDIIKSDSFGSSLFVLGKKILTCVSAEGKIRFNNIFAFTNPDMSVSDNYGIAFDRGSSDFFIFNTKGVIYEGETEENKHIITARINNRGDVVFVTKSEDAACRVYLMDKKGETGYIWSCANEYVVSTYLSEDGRNILCGAIGSQNGTVYTKLYLLDTYSDTEKAQFTVEGAGVIDVYLSGRKIIATCNEGRYVFNSSSDDNTPQAVVEYPSNIIDFSSDGNGNTAVVTNKVGSFGTNEITVYNKNNEISYKGFTDESAVDVICRGKKVYLLSDKAVLESSSDGTFETVSTEEISGEGLVICKSRMYYYSTGQIDINS